MDAQLEVGWETAIPADQGYMPTPPPTEERAPIRRQRSLKELGFQVVKRRRVIHFMREPFDPSSLQPGWDLAGPRDIPACQENARRDLGMQRAPNLRGRGTKEDPQGTWSTSRIFTLDQNQNETEQSHNPDDSSSFGMSHNMADTGELPLQSNGQPTTDTITTEQLPRPYVTLRPTMRQQTLDELGMRTLSIPTLSNIVPTPTQHMPTHNQHQCDSEPALDQQLPTCETARPRQMLQMELEGVTIQRQQTVLGDLHTYLGGERTLGMQRAPELRDRHAHGSQQGTLLFSPVNLLDKHQNPDQRLQSASDSEAVSHNMVQPGEDANTYVQVWRSRRAPHDDADKNPTEYVQVCRSRREPHDDAYESTTSDALSKSLS